MTIALRKLATAVSLSVLAACSGGSSEDHIDKAAAFLDQQEYNAATIELKNALQKDAQSARARWMLGKIYLDTGDFLSAEKELERAQRLGWGPNDVVPALAQVLLARGDHEGLGELDTSALQAAAQARVLVTKAQGELDQGDTRLAEQLIDQALELAPALPEGRLAHARLKILEGEATDALAEVDALLADHPEMGRAWSLRGDINARQGQNVAAVADYSQAIEHSRFDLSERFKRGLLELGAGNLEAAQVDAQKLLKRYPHHPGGNYIQGLLDFAAQNYESAITALSVAEPAARAYPMVLFYLGTAHMLQGSIDQAAVFANRFYTAQPSSVPGRKLLATVRLQQGRFRDVINVLEPVLESAPDDVDALNLAANAHLRLGDADQGITLLSRVAELSPDSPAAQVRLGAGMLMGGQSAAGEAHIQTALELDPKFQQADMLLVLNHLQNQDYDAALAAAQAYQRRNPGIVTPFNLLGRVQLAAGQTEAAAASFDRAIALEPADPAAHHNLAQIALANDDIDTARGHYDAILAEHDKFLGALLQLAKLDGMQGNTVAMEARLQQAMDAHPTALEPRLAMAQHLLATGNIDNIPTLFSSLDELQRKDPRVLELLAIAQLNDADPTQAAQTVEQLAATEADSARTQHLLAMSAAARKDEAGAEEALNRAIELDANFLPSRIALARMALRNKNQASFQRHLQVLREQAPQNPDVLQLIAHDAASRKDYDVAIAASEQALATEPNVRNLLTLTAYRLAAKQTDLALDGLREWNAEHPEEISTRLALASHLQAGGEREEPQQLYGEVLAADNNNIVALNNMAWFLREEETDQALEYIRRAGDLAPESPEVLDTLAVVEYHDGQHRRAQRTIARALALSNNPSMRYHQAMIEAALEENDRARANLEQLLSEVAEFPERAQAQELLARLR